MSNLKCPFCQQELNYLADDIYYCPNHQKHMGSEELWQELIRTRKAFDVAVDALKRTNWCATDYGQAQDALDKIMALAEIKNITEKEGK